MRQPYTRSRAAGLEVFSRRRLAGRIIAAFSCRVLPLRRVEEVSGGEFMPRPRALLPLAYIYASLAALPRIPSNRRPKSRKCPCQRGRRRELPPAVVSRSAYRKHRFGLLARHSAFKLGMLAQPVP